MVELLPEITAYYDKLGEIDRLSRSLLGRLEFERTVEIVRRFLPAPSAARILDVGGATGIHARWLIAAGHDVLVVDPVDSQVEAARLVGIPAETGDARELAQADASFDVVLMLGPLYHLTAATDRARSLGEAQRVLVPGGVLIAAAISRYAALIDLAILGLLDELRTRQLESIHSDGANIDTEMFTTSYFHLPAQLASEVSAAGFADVQVLPVEGPAGAALRFVAVDDEVRLEHAVRCARVAEALPDLLPASGHLLAVGRKPV